jgi:hypothetical protein
MIDIQDIQSLTDFQRNTRRHIARLKKTGRPEVLTVNGRAELVVQNAETYRALAARAENADLVHEWDRRLEECRQGLGRDVDEVFDELDQKYFGKKLSKKHGR